MSFEAVLGNTEFELVVFGVTFAVVTRLQLLGMVYQYLVSVTGRVDSTYSHFFLNSLKKSQITGGNSCNYCINNVQTLGLRVWCISKNSLLVTAGKP